MKKGTMTSSSNHEGSGTRTSFLAGKRNLSSESLRTTTSEILFILALSVQEMTSFRDVQNLLLSHGSNFIEDEEFLILYDLFEPRNPDFPHEAYAKFDLDETAESESLSEFRFRKRDILSLAEVLDIPETIRCEQRSICGGIEGLFVLLRRLSYPCRYGDMIQRFAKPVSLFSMVSNILIDHMCYPWSTAYPVKSLHLESRSS